MDNKVRGTSFPSSRLYKEPNEAAKESSNDDDNPEEAHCSSTPWPLPPIPEHSSLQATNSGTQQGFKETSFSSRKELQEGEDSDASEAGTVHCTCDDDDCKGVSFGFKSPPPVVSPPPGVPPPPLVCPPLVCTTVTTPFPSVCERSRSKCRPCIELNTSFLSVIISLAGLLMMIASHTTPRWMLMYRGEDPSQAVYVGLHMLCAEDVNKQYPDENGKFIAASTCHQRPQFYKYGVEESQTLVILILMLVSALFAVIGILSSTLFSRFKTVSLSKTLISVSYYVISGLCGMIGLIIWTNMVDTQRRKDKTDGLFILYGDGFYYALFGIVWQFMAAAVSGLAYCLISG